jgi:hypothetical protein
VNRLPYFSTDNARVICTKNSKLVKNERARYTFESYEREIKCEQKCCLIFIEHFPFEIQKILHQTRYYY